MDIFEFSTGSVPVCVAAKALGKDQAWVRAGLVAGWLPIGVATRGYEMVTDIEKIDAKYGRLNFYISPKKLYEFSGYVWKGEKK